MKILVYGKSKLLHSVAIKNQEKFDTTVTYASPGSNGQSSPFNEERVDSLIILFSDGKAIEFYCEGRLLVSAGAFSPKCRYGKIPTDFGSGTFKAKKSSQTNIKTLVYDESDYLKATFL